MNESFYTLLIDYKHDEDTVIYQIKLISVVDREIKQVVNFIRDHVEVLQGIIILPERALHDEKTTKKH